MNSYQQHILPNGLRIIYLPSNSPVAYCGFTVNAGTRDELPEESGIAHFVEHLLFKGTKKRKALHIINRMEHVGGELNAYTAKEETVIHASFLSEDTERAIELLSDLIFHSQFPENELEKEKEVVLDEFKSYKDNPAELIYDEFENQLFAGHPIGHNILGEIETINRFDTTNCRHFFKKYYTPENLVFFFMGNVPFPRIMRLITKYAGNIPPGETIRRQKTDLPENSRPENRKINMDLHQSHVILGTQAFNMFDEKRMSLFLLNNLLGGPGMNSRLNLSLREKHGLVYNVESNATCYTDTGLFSIYFACDINYREKCIKLIYKELKKLREHSLTGSQLHIAKKQMKGQMGISWDNSENTILGISKTILHKNSYPGLESIYREIEQLTSSDLLETANLIFNEHKLSRLIIEPEK